jgi:tRNA-Thr(GGU) m(6)t(6)A37 methyltransferase TsaA
MKHLCLIVLGVFVLAVWPPPPVEADNQQAAPKQFAVYPIGQITKQDGRTTIIRDRKYQPGLLGLDGLSHVYVLYWFDRNDTPENRSILQVYPRNNKENPLSGVFATRAPVRPNLIALSLCKVISVRENVIEIDQIDAFPNTPVHDLKPYVPSRDSADASLPEWLESKSQSSGATEGRNEVSP